MIRRITVPEDSGFDSSRPLRRKGKFTAEKIAAAGDDIHMVRPRNMLSVHMKFDVHKASFAAETMSCICNRTFDYFRILFA